MPTGEESDGVLSVSEISVSFGGIAALDGVSLEVAQGEVLGIIGPNGAGKTTLFNVICGFVTPDSGTLYWHGRALPRVRPHRLASLGIARTLQGVGLFPQLTVLENVMMGAERFRRSGITSALLGLPRADRDERALLQRAETALGQMDCADVAARRPAELPYAVQKRVALARALVGDPELLLLDEPAGGLDAGELSALAATIDALGDTIAVMIVDHHMDLVTSVCDRMVVLDFGRVVASGVPSEVRQDPQVLEAYLGQAAAPSESGAPTGSRDAVG